MSSAVTQRLRAAGVVALAGLAALAGSLATQRLVGAEASHEDPCANADIETQAVFNVTGVVPIGKVCNTGLFNGGQWSNPAKLEGHATQLMDRCANAQGGNRYLTQAIIEITGVPPSDGACDRNVYEDFVDDTFGTSYSINWNQYKGSTTTVESVFRRQPDLLDLRPQVDLPGGDRGRKRLPRHSLRPAPRRIVLGQRAQRPVQPVVVRQRRDLALRPPEGERPGPRERGACSTIGNPQATQISNAYLAITGWYPSPPLGECNPSLYGAGSWADDTELRTRIYHSWFCYHGNIGQIFWFSKGRRVDGRQFSGECNPLLYEDGTGVPGATPAARYQELETRLGVTTTSLVNANIDLDDDGDAEVNGTFVPSDEIVIGNNGTGNFRFGDGNQLPSGLTIPPAQATQIAAGNFVATNGGTLIGQAGTNLIGQAGTNVIASGGGNVIASAAATSASLHEPQRPPYDPAGGAAGRRQRRRGALRGVGRWRAGGVRHLPARAGADLAPAHRGRRRLRGPRDRRHPRPRGARRRPGARTRRAAVLPVRAHLHQAPPRVPRPGPGARAGQIRAVKT